MPTQHAGRQLGPWAIVLAGALLTGCTGVRFEPSSAPYRTADEPSRTYPAAAGSAMRFTDHGTRPFTHADDERKSSFAVDVDTASYTMVRAYLARNEMPPPAAVRTEELINALPYGYPSPEKGPLAIYTEMCPAPFRSGLHLLRVGLQARRVHAADRTPADITLLIDVSGSMNARGKFDLVRQACRVLLDQLDRRDRVAVVAYNTRAWQVLGFSRASEAGPIMHAITALRPGGRTSVQAGLTEAYRLAREVYDSRRTSRVILFSDGVANTDSTRADGILASTRHWREKGTTLTTIGVGLGNYNDTLLEQLADKGDGNYHYVDTIEQVRRILGRRFTGISELVARDVKVQVEFDRKLVRRYRLMGYENRHLTDRQFRDRKADGGEMGAGDSVTALYAVELNRDPAMVSDSTEVATVRVRYLKPNGSWTHTLQREVRARQIRAAFASASDDTRLAATAAHFAESLRDTYWSRRYGLRDVLTIGRAVRVNAERRQQLAELLGMIESARGLAPAGGGPAGDIDEDEELRWWEGGEQQR